MFRADLHCHSTASDGTYLPCQIVDLAKSRELEGLALTDHDTVQGSIEARSYAEKQGIKFVSGIEISAEHDSENVHLLLYAFNPKDPLISSLEKRQKNYRKERNKGILQKLAACGIDISEEELYTASSADSIGRPHIAQILMKKGKAQSVQDAFNKYIGNGKPCNYHVDRISCAEVLDIAKRLNCFSVIAHPHLLGSAKLAESLLKMPFDGIEGYYALFPPSKEKPWIDLAMKHDLFVTGGSDFHGDVKPQIRLGCSWTNEDVFAILWQRDQENNR